MQYDTFVTPLAGHREMVAALTPHQRAALGWPEAGHPYWRSDTLSFVQDRYGDSFDPEPYVAAGLHEVGDVEASIRRYLRLPARM